jgi:hypothetical protein
MLNETIWFIQNAFCAGIVLKVAGILRFDFHGGLKKNIGMNKYLYLLLIFSVLIAGGCKLESPNEVIIDNKVDIYYINSRHEDLLDTVVNGSFTADSIHLYNVLRGVKKEVNNRADYPHNFFIYKNEELQKYVLRVFLEVDTTFLELNRNITDTITCVFERSVDNFIIRKVWYNGNVKWDDYAVSREFTIMK